MSQLSPRLVRQIEADFPHHADLVQRHLTGLDRLFDESSQDHERLQAAVVRLAAGRLDLLDQAIELARTDWRDVLMTAGLAEEDWPTRLSAWLEPANSRGTASPGTSGELTETDGHQWRVRRRRIDLRMVKRLLRRPDVVVVLGESGGFRPRRIPAAERAAVWRTVERAYAGPGSRQQMIGGTDYMGHEFTDQSGVIMLYLEERC